MLVVFPDSGSGSIQIGPIYPQTRHPIPLHLRPIAEANTKYQLASVLGMAGECYCEVSLSGRNQIDLIWIDTEREADSPRIIGIEIKTTSEFKRATHKLESQVEQYRTQTVSDLTNVTLVAGDSITYADETYLFDDVWVVAVGDHDRWELPWQDDPPEDGWLNYNPVTGRLKYDIDSTPNRETIQLDYGKRVGEAQLTTFLWDRYQSSQTLVAAETQLSKPQDRLIRDRELKYHAGKGQGGKTKRADLVVSKLSEVDPLGEDSLIRGLEVKTSFDAGTRDRLTEQLSLYCDSGLFSEVYLVVQDNDSQAAKAFLETKHPRVGLLSVDLETPNVSQKRQAKPLELRKVPIGRLSESDPEFQL